MVVSAFLQCRRPSSALDFGMEPVAVAGGWAAAGPSFSVFIPIPTQNQKTNLSDLQEGTYSLALNFPPNILPSFIKISVPILSTAPSSKPKAPELHNQRQLLHVFFSDTGVSCFSRIQWSLILRGVEIICVCRTSTLNIHPLFLKQM